MDRLSPLDTSFLYLEGPRTPMHISSLAIYEGPAPADTELRAMLERRLPLVPRFRQRLATVPLSGHRPVWIDDEDFDIEAHLSHVALFEPTDDALLQLSGRVLSQPLCRTRPLWEMWLITGLSKGRFAVLSKTHHSMWDGISGVDLHAVLLDDSPDAPQDGRIEAFEPRPEPSGLGMLIGAARDRLRETVANTKTVSDALRDPSGTWKNLSRFAKDATSFASSMLRPAPVSTLNGRLGSRRRYALARGSLHEVEGPALHARRERQRRDLGRRRGSVASMADPPRGNAARRPGDGSRIASHIRRRKQRDGQSGLDGRHRPAGDGPDRAHAARPRASQRWRRRSRPDTSRPAKRSRGCPGSCRPAASPRCRGHKR